MAESRPQLADPREVAVREQKPADQVRAALERMKPQLELALPKHLTADRLLRVAMTAIQNTPKLLECDRTSLYAAVMTCAQLGLEPDGVLGQAYLVPYGNRVTFIPGYKGLISLARNSGDVTSIAAHEIRDNDTFKFDFANGEPPSHTFDIRKPRGDIIGVYAIARFTDGSFYWDLMTKEEVDRIRDGSSGYRAAIAFAKRNNKPPEGPWIDHYVEMSRKTAIRRIAKYLPLSVQKAAAIADAYDTGQRVSIDSHGELVIDGTAAEVVESEQEVQEQQVEQQRRPRRGRPPKDAAPPAEAEPEAAPEQAEPGSEEPDIEAEADARADEIDRGDQAPAQPARGGTLGLEFC